jgi:hypothetical protein
MGNARLRRAVFGVAPNPFVPPDQAHGLVREQFVSWSRHRDGGDRTRDACAPNPTASLAKRKDGYQLNGKCVWMQNKCKFDVEIKP